MSVIYTMLLGIWGTILLHVGRSMQSQGLIQKRKKLYIIGLCMDLSSVIWLTLGNLFGPPSYYTSMYGFGLIALILYSRYIMHDKISKWEYFAALVLILGTGLMGIDGLQTDQPSFSLISKTKLVNFALIFAGGATIVLIGSLKIKDRVLVGIVIGAIAGGFSALEPVMRAVGQNSGADSPGIFPTDPSGWPIFIVSFAGSIIALLLTQWAFYRKARATMLVPTFNCIYIILPTYIQLAALEGFKITAMMITGMVFTLGGIVWLNIIKINKEQQQDSEIDPPAKDRAQPDIMSLAE